MGFHSCAPMSSAPDVHVEENGRNTARYLGRYRGVRANGTKTYVNVCVSATYCAKVSGVKFLCVYFAMLLPIARHSGGESGTGSDALYISTR